MDIVAARDRVLSSYNAEEYDHFGKVAFRIRAKKAGGKPGRTFMTLWLDEGHAVLMLDDERQTTLMEEHPDAFVPHPSKWGEKGATIMRLSAVNVTIFDAAVQVAFAWAAR